MAKQLTPSLIARVEGLPIILVFVLLLALFMYLAPQVFLQPVHLHDLPLDAAAADPARHRPHLRHRRRRDRPLLSRDHRFLRLRLRRSLQGIRPRLARRGRRLGLGRARRLRQRRPGRQDRHPLLHRDARHAVLLGRHGDGAVGRQVLRAARRRGELGLADGSSAGHSPAPAHAIWVQQIPLQSLVDRGHRDLPVVHPEPAPLRRARPVHRRFQRRLAGASASTSTARRSSSSR